jgi:WXG100 family type VII secretion target
MGRYGISLTQLADIISAMEKLVGEVDDAVTAVDKRVTDLHVEWVGATAQAQRDAHQRWVKGAREMHAGLDELRQAAQRAHDNYSGVLEANDRMWP